MNLTRIEWGVGWVLLLAATITCLVPGQELPKAFEYNDKLSHLMGHGVLALYFTGLVPRRKWWKVFLYLVLFGVGIEIAQYTMHMGREGDPRDVVANSLGALLGLLAGFLGASRWPELVAWAVGRKGIPQ